MSDWGFFCAKTTRYAAGSGWDFANRSAKQQLLGYVGLLDKWNKAYNLTSVRDPKEMLVRHILDSIVVNPFLQGNRFIDVGTGPGLPGIPLAIVRPESHFTLLDSLGKRVRFLRQVQHELKLTNIEPVQSRVEEFLLNPVWRCYQSCICFTARHAFLVSSFAKAWVWPLLRVERCSSWWRAIPASKWRWASFRWAFACAYAWWWKTFGHSQNKLILSFVKKVKKVTDEN